MLGYKTEKMGYRNIGYRSPVTFTFSISSQFHENIMIQQGVWDDRLSVFFTAWIHTHIADPDGFLEKKIYIFPCFCRPTGSGTIS